MSNNTDKKENKTIDDAIFDFIYIAAMRDATMRLAYRGEKEWLWNPSENDTDTIDTVKRLLGSHVLNILNGIYSKQEQFSSAFLKLSMDICKSINEHKGEDSYNGSFRFGNAQKLINMTVKYFYITTFGQSEKRKCFKYCHCPVDGKMLKRVWTDKIKQENNWRSDVFQDSWSGEGFNEEDKKRLPKRYEAFQIAVQALVGKNGIPLEYDYMNWN